MQTSKRNTDLNEILFKVNMQDIFTKIGENGNSINIPGKKVLLNAVNNFPISIVSDDYEIITNEEAYQYGIKCLQSLFKITEEDGIDIFHIDRPSTLSFCHIDLTSKTKTFEYRNDKYFPFVRVTNSYNKMFKLYFRVGVCRWICENGMIMGDNSIKFSYNHMKGANNRINFEIEGNALDKILLKFKNNIEMLSEKTFNYNFLLPMVYKGLGVAPRKYPMSKKQVENAAKMDETINRMNDIYSEQIGKNFYSVYNIITDISSRGIENENFGTARIHNRQLNAGRWMAIVSDMLRKDDFNYEKFLKEYLDTSKN